MYTKTFKKHWLHDNTIEANRFIDKVELGDKGGVQYDRGDIIIFYSHFKKDNHSRSLSQMIEGLKDTIYNTNIRRLSLETDLKVHKETEATPEKIQEVEDLIKETDKNLKLYTTRLEALTKYKLI
jgi:spermidine/putrescine-binding protein